MGMVWGVALLARTVRESNVKSVNLALRAEKEERWQKCSR